jgi:hypothetical protein
MLSHEGTMKIDKEFEAGDPPCGIEPEALPRFLTAGPLLFIGD